MQCCELARLTASTYVYHTQYDVKGDMQRFFTKLIKVVSSYLLQYKPICVTNFDKLRRKMIKRSLVVFLI